MQISKYTSSGMLIIGVLACQLAIQPGCLLAGEATDVVLQPATSEQQPASAATEPQVEPKPDRAADDVGPDGLHLTLAEATDRALDAHPGLASLDKEYWALDSIAWQEGRKPNPELEFEFEEFGGTDDARGVKSMATSLTYTQSIERGGKRTKREVAASLEREIVYWDIALLEYEIQADVRNAFAAAQAAQYQQEQLQRYRSLVQQIYDTVAISVEAGRSARLELERIEVELARLDLESKMAGLNLEQARLELAGTWGVSEVDFDLVEAAAPKLTQLPELPELRELLDDLPMLGRFDAEYEALCALVDLENANAVSDLALFGGISRLNEINETVFKVGVAWDLTVNDKNEGNINAAGYRLEQVADNRAAVRRELETELAAQHMLAQNTLVVYLAYGANLLPAASESMALIEEGFRYGKFELLDVLDAQRTVLELEGEQTAALMELHLQLAEIEGLLNISLADLPGHEVLEAPADQSETAVAESGLNEENSNE